MNGFLGTAFFCLLRQLAAALDFAYRPTVFNRFLSQFQLINYRQCQQCSGMPHLQVAAVKQLLNRFRQGQQAEGIGNRTAAFADGFGNGFMRQAEFVGETLQAACFFNRVEVFPLQVFNQTHCQRGFVADVFDDDGNLGQPGQLAGAPAAFSGDQFVLRQSVLAHDNRLNNALGFDGLRQFLQCFVIHLHARLVTSGLDVAYGYRG